MSVGSLSLRVHDPVKGVEFPLWVLYPTDVPSSDVSFGPFQLKVAPGAPAGAGPYPLVVLSHGHGGSPYLYRTIAHGLAQNGYVVALPEHYGNHRGDDSLGGTAENLELRPRHVSLAIDAAFSAPGLRASLRPDRVSVIGHSIGGYTALAVAGGQPWWSPERKIPVRPDPRVQALVLMAPAGCWFVPNDALKEVKAPILLYAAERDLVTHRWQSQLVLEQVPDSTQVTYRVIENAGHFSFMSPFPQAVVSPSVPPSVDPRGFERARFHERLNLEILSFLDEKLK